VKPPGGPPWSVTDPDSLQTTTTDVREQNITGPYTVLSVLELLSELISPAATEASNVSYGKDDRDPVLTAKHVTT